MGHYKTLNMSSCPPATCVNTCVICHEDIEGKDQTIWGISYVIEMECGHHNQLCTLCLRTLVQHSSGGTIAVFGDKKEQVHLVKEKDFIKCPLCRVFYHPIVSETTTTEVKTITLMGIRGHMEHADGWIHVLIKSNTALWIKYYLWPVIDDSRFDSNSQSVCALLSTMLFDGVLMKVAKGEYKEYANWTCKLCFCTKPNCAKFMITPIHFEQGNHPFFQWNEYLDYTRSLTRPITHSTANSNPIPHA